jgi:transcription elongation factor Elf1
MSADEIRFGQIRAARRELDLKERVVAGILNIPPEDLRKGEYLDSVIPSVHADLARQIIGFAERVQHSPGPRVKGHSRRSVLLRFERPRCLDCRHPLNVTVTGYSSCRGDYWYFKCPKCGRRYWSKDGLANAVNPKGNWKTIRGRLRCDACGLECRIKSGHIWECPRCRKRFRNAKGRAVPAMRGRRPGRVLPFLQKRECPNCRSSSLCITAVPRPPKVRHFYFRCGSCGRRCRFDKRMGRLVLLKLRSSPS